jgi:hypothetical protein
MNFKELANRLLNSVVLVISDSEKKSRVQFRFAEIEFYLFSESHPDPYTHQSADQKCYNRFYFHKFGNGTYKAGTWKGLDLCFGSYDTHFGVLIRSLIDLNTNELIEGPCLCVNKILSHFSCQGVKDFVTQILGGDLDFDFYDKTKPLHLRKVEHLDQEDLYHGPRIGLSNKWPDYKDLPYRYCILRDRIKKNKRSLIKVENI